MAFGSRHPACRRIDAGVVDDRIHAADGIDRVGDRSCLGRAAQVADDNTE